MLSDYFTENSVNLDVPANSPEEAIECAGRILVKEHKVAKPYVESMIENYHKLGSYIVIAPNIAMPHAAPGDYVYTPCVSFVRLSSPICFNHPTNDPVRFVFAVGARTGLAHLSMLKDLSKFLLNSENIETLSEIHSNSEFISLLKKGGKENEGD